MPKIIVSITLLLMHMNAFSAVADGEYHQIVYMNDLKGLLLLGLIVFSAAFVLGGLFLFFRGIFKDGEAKNIVFDLEKKKFEIGNIGQGALVTIIGIFAVLAVIDKIPERTTETKMTGKGIILPGEQIYYADSERQALQALERTSP